MGEKNPTIPQRDKSKENLGLSLTALLDRTLASIAA
jgi:hypothetical protein